MNLALEITDLNKSFFRSKALNGINLNVEEGKIYGFLGRNGAGKTTLLKIITGQYIQNSGTLKVLGENPFENEKILKHICFVSDSPNFIKTFTVREIFNISRAFRASSWDKDFENRLIKEFELNINKRFKDLSRGMQSIVSIIIGLASRAKLTIYDEAYTGLDAVAREKFYNILLEDYGENPRTIIFSTHIIDEVNRMFEDVIIIDKGRIILKENTDVLRDRAFYISGEKEIVEKVLRDKNIIGKETLGKYLNAAVFQEISKEDRLKFKNMGLEVKNIPLQKFFVHLTSTDAERE